MKTHAPWLPLAVMASTLFFLTTSHALGAVRLQSTAGAVLERGPHHCVQEVFHHYLSPSGEPFTRAGTYTLLGTGRSYWEEGEWRETRSEIEVFNGAAVARQGPIKVVFAANLNSPGAIDMLSPQGQRFRSHLLGLAYTDASLGVLLAEPKECVGGVLPPNEVHYQDAFDGDVLADVRYIYSPHGVEQDIVILAAPPPPSEWNLPEESIRLEV